MIQFGYFRVKDDPEAINKAGVGVNLLFPGEKELKYKRIWAKKFPFGYKEGMKGKFAFMPCKGGDKGAMNIGIERYIIFMDVAEYKDGVICPKVTTEI